MKRSKEAYTHKTLKEQDRGVPHKVPGLAERQKILLELWRQGEITAQEYEQRKMRVKAAEALCKKLVDVYGHADSTSEDRDRQLVREELLSTDPDLRYSILVDATAMYPDIAMELLEGCFGADEDIDKDLVGVLGQHTSSQAAEKLIQWLTRTQSKTLRKYIKKTLHSLRSKGVPIPPLEELEDRRPVWTPAPAPKSYGLVSIFDRAGRRFVWLLRPGRPKGYFVVTGVTHDHEGLLVLECYQVSSKKALSYREEIKSTRDVPVVDIDAAYCAFLLKEAYEKISNKEKNPAAEMYELLRDLIEEMVPNGRPDTPIYTVVSPEADGAEDSLGETKHLLRHDFIRGWTLSNDEVARYAEQLQEIQESPIITSQHLKKERMESCYLQAAREIFSAGPVRAVWKRRLEEMAWIFYQTGSVREAHLAVRIARHLSDPSADPARLPFLFELVKASIDEQLALKKKKEAEEPSLIVKPR